MKKTFATVEELLDRDSWIFLSILFVVSLIYTLSMSGNIKSLILFLPLAVLTFSPTLIFTWFRLGLRNKISKRKYNFIWALVFLVLPAICITFHLLTFAEIIRPQLFGPDIFLILGIAFLAVELLLKFNRYFDHRIKKIQWIRNINLDKLVLGMAIFLGIIFGGLATSNLDTHLETGMFNDFINLFEIASHPIKFIGFSSQFIIAFGTLYIFYWINRHLLIGRLLKLRGFIIYVLGFITTIAFLYPTFSFLLSRLPISRNYVSLLPSGNLNILDEMNFLVPLCFMIVSSPIIIIQEWFSQNAKINRLAKDKVEKELDFLKQQINPHFFFNTLNNLYALSLQKSEQTPEVVMQLSDLMRYVIYKGKEDYVTMGEELEYIEDYIQLQRLRHHQQLDFTFNNSIDDNTIPIPPLLLIVLVENAFKHGVESAEEASFVHISMHNQDDDLFFEISNSVEEGYAKPSGIGLENLQRRLDLLYEDHYDLEFKSDNGIFRVKLNLYSG